MADTRSYCLAECPALRVSSPNFRRVDFDVLSIGTDRFALLVSLERLPHVKCVGAIGVVVQYPAVDRVSVHIVSE
jgi:hypothetical protein